MTGGMSGGHFVGFYLAILGLVALTLVSTRPSILRRLGTRRWPVVGVAIFSCVLLAIFGSGSREIYFRTLIGPKEEVLPRIDQNHVDEALREILRPEFLQYMEQLDSGSPITGGERMSTALSVRVGTTVDLRAEGYHFEPPPALGQTYFFVSYVDRENALLAVLHGDAGVRRMALAERLVSRVLPQAAAIVALRTAKTDEEKMAILKENPFVMPYAAEWLSSELGKMAQDASLPLVQDIARKRTYIQQYIDNPAVRDVKADGRIDPP